jgi:cyclic nucleotide gated channel, plant
MGHRQLPHELRERVRRFVHYKWLATRGVDEESILSALPTDLRRDIKRHLCLYLVRRVNQLTTFALSFFYWSATELVT